MDNYQFAAMITVGVLNLVSSLLVPLVVSVAYLIKHVKKSECCGSKLDIDITPSP